MMYAEAEILSLKMTYEKDNKGDAAYVLMSGDVGWK